MNHIVLGLTKMRFNNYFMALLKQVKFTLPSTNDSFAKEFLHYLSPKGQVIGNKIDFQVSNEYFLPKASFQFEGSEHPFVTFVFDDSSAMKIAMINVTNTTKQSPHHYSHISLEEFMKRMSSFPLVGLDHTGFNLPFFEGIHPRILELREQLKQTCLYHTFPKHLEDAPWDFIIPGTKEEIERSTQVDYQRVRKPKVEIVSFENSSTPLIQIDIQINGRYEDLVATFPEALHVPDIRNMWVYVKNEFGIDLCFVLNEVSEKDWSYQFAKERL